MVTIPSDKKWLTVTLLAGIILLIVILKIAGGAFNQKAGNQTLKAEEVYSIANVLNIHSSPIKQLTIDKHRYRNLLGFKPYYLEVPSLKSIVFVTETNSMVTYHVFNLASNEDINIPGAQSGFGLNIGRTEGVYRDVIESVEGNVIVVAQYGEGYKGLYYLDVSKRAVDKKEVFVYDADKKVIKHRIDQ